MSNLKAVKFNPREESVESFKSRFPVENVMDTYAGQLEEIFLIRNPRYRFDKNYKDELEKFLSEYAGSDELTKKENWFYFPWNRLLVHYLPDEIHQELRTARNKNLINKEEQEKFYNSKIGIAGLSVGSHAAFTIAMMGGGRFIKLADPDEISGSNLNRIRYDFTEIGANKCDIVGRRICQLNPYSEIYLYQEGISEENVDKFLAGPPKLDILVEELDHPLMKVMLRLKARELGIPVIMATDNGDNVIIDVERYDLDRTAPIFNGALGDIGLEDFKKFSPQELPKIATQIAGPSSIVPRMLGSVLEVGKTLYSWPQLGDAATLSGAAVAYLVKRIAIGEKLNSGKYDVSLDSVFDSEYNSSESVERRESERKKSLKVIGLGQ